MAPRKTAHAKKSAKKATGGRPKTAPKAASTVKKATERSAKAITNTARKAVKATPKVVTSVAKKTHTGARRAKAIGVTLEKVGRLVEAGAAAVDTVASAIEKPVGGGQRRTKTSTKPRKRSA